MSSYFKDPDRHTRGVNAIARADGVTTRLRQIENAKTRAMNRRDQTMARMARQAFSSRAALGMIDLAPTRQATYLSGGKIITNPFPSPSGGAGTSAPRPTVTSPTFGYTAPGTGTAFQPTVGLTRPNYTGTTGTPPTIVVPPSGGGSLSTSHPWGPLAPSPTDGGSGGSVLPGTPNPFNPSGGGGSGGSVLPGTPQPGVPTIDENALIDINQPGAVDVAVIGGGMSRNTKLLLLAGLAVGGFLWWRSSKKKG